MATSQRGQYDEIGPGSLLWAWVADRRSHRVKRPCVVLQRLGSSGTGGTPEKWVVAAVSTDQDLSPPHERVELPFNPEREGGHPVTGLKRRCWAVGSWLEIIDSTDIDQFKGKRLPPEELNRLLQIVKRLTQ